MNRQRLHQYGFRSSGKTRPRKPPMDLRPITARAILFVSLLPSVMLAIAVDRHGVHSDFGTGLGLSLIACLLMGAIAWSWSIYFESHHLHETPEFWVQQEAKIRPRMFG